MWFPFQSSWRPGWFVTSGFQTVLLRCLLDPSNRRDLVRDCVTSLFWYFHWMRKMGQGLSSPGTACRIFLWSKWSCAKIPVPPSCFFLHSFWHVIQSLFSCLLRWRVQHFTMFMSILYSPLIICSFFTVWSYTVSFCLIHLILLSEILFLCGTQDWQPLSMNQTKTTPESLN